MFGVCCVLLLCVLRCSVCCVYCSVCLFLFLVFLYAVRFRCMYGVLYDFSVCFVVCCSVFLCVFVVCCLLFSVRVVVHAIWL